MEKGSVLNCFENQESEHKVNTILVELQHRSFLKNKCRLNMFTC